MNLKLIIAILFLFALVPILNAEKICECGSHDTSIITYKVEGVGCCTSAPFSHGHEFVYQENEGAWEVISSTQIPGTTAQNKCCPPN